VIDFKISSFCDGGGCVEVGQLPTGSIAVRDSKDPDRATALEFTTEEWAAFVLGVKAGEFDPIQRLL
jgi:hypothetical protein